MRRIVLTLGLVFGVAAAAHAEVPGLLITLEQAETEALAASKTLQTKRLEVEAAHAKANGQSALLWPRVSLEGSATYMTAVPEIHLQLPRPMGEMNLSMGDHLNYSVGLAASWNVWDSFAVYESWQALQKAETAKQAEVEAAEREVRLKTRLAYFQTQLTLERVKVLLDALNLANAQYADIQAKLRAGASNRMDGLSSELDVLSRKKQLREARTDLADALRELCNWLGRTETPNLSLPLSADQTTRLPKGVAAPSVLITLDSLETSRAKLEPIMQQTTPSNNPNLRSLLAIIEATHAMGRSAAAGYWPQLNLYAKASMDYPNGPVLETVQQNMVNAKASWTLWQAGRVGSQVEEQRLQAKAQETKRSQVEADINLAWVKAKDRVQQLQDVHTMNAETVEQATKLSKLVYEAYRAGRVPYLDVQAANLRVLEAETQALITETQIVIQLALLESLS